MNGLRLRLTLICAVIVVLSFATQAPAWAQAEDTWSFVLTPQVWASHIAKNGFTAPSGLGYSPITSGPNLLFNQFRAENSGPVDSVNPQWGLQLAAQKGRWTLPRPVREAKLARLDETPLSDLPLGENQTVVEFTAARRAVVTLLVR